MKIVVKYRKLPNPHFCYDDSTEISSQENELEVETEEYVHLTILVYIQKLHLLLLLLLSSPIFCTA